MWAVMKHVAWGQPMRCCRPRRARGTRPMRAPLCGEYAHSFDSIGIAQSHDHSTVFKVHFPDIISQNQHFSHEVAFILNKKATGSLLGNACVF